MPSLNRIARDRTKLTDDQLEWLHLLLGDWQLLADLSFGDLVLWLPLADASGFVAGAQMRPTTAQTVYHDDVVGREVPIGRRPLLESAFNERRIWSERVVDPGLDAPVRDEWIPVVRADTSLAVVSRHSNLAAARTPSRLELTYLRSADDLARMISQGHFPVDEPPDQLDGSPRVGDGLIRLDAAGVVTFASPNSLSAFRRLGIATDLAGRHLPSLITTLTQGKVRRPEAATPLGRSSSPAHLEVDAAGGTVRLRTIRLVDHDVEVGALVLCRDVTEVRRRERELVSKDATIREIHHRVKNNLQTVAALLRLQSRRLESSEAREALEEAQRRVASIALVHETLSQTLDAEVAFDDVVDRIVEMVAGSRDGSGEVRVVRKGHFGTLPPEVATALSLVLVELLQNAVEHGLGDRGGIITLKVDRGSSELELAVEDDGRGFVPATVAGAPGQVGSGLGLQIVRTLVETELGGVLAFAARAPGAGTTATVRLELATQQPPA